MELSKKERMFLDCLPDNARVIYRNLNGFPYWGTLKCRAIYPLPQYMKGWYKCVKRGESMTIEELKQLEIDGEENGRVSS